VQRANICELQTTYGYAWVTSSPEPNSPLVAVPTITSEFRILEGFKRGHVLRDTRQNSLRAESHDQWKGIQPDGVCSCVDVSARAEFDGQDPQVKGQRICP
jgi:hypothetical protein